mgnify:CR=1 FL=1|jgi:uncharacterized protein
MKLADTNIDHRRIQNLMVFFEGHGLVKSITKNSEDYSSSDIVSWNLGGGTNHIGIVVDRKSEDGKQNLIVHNIGVGQVVEDCLFEFRVIGHYFYK